MGPSNRYNNFLIMVDLGVIEMKVHLIGRRQDSILICALDFSNVKEVYSKKIVVSCQLASIKNLNFVTIQ